MEGERERERERGLVGESEKGGLIGKREVK